MFEGTKLGIIDETEWHDCYTFFRICYNSTLNYATKHKNWYIFKQKRYREINKNAVFCLTLHQQPAHALGEFL